MSLLRTLLTPLNKFPKLSLLDEAITLNEDDLFYLNQASDIPKSVRFKNIYPISEVYVYSVADFPDPVGGVIQLENKVYYLQTIIYMPYTLKLPATGTARFTAALSDNALVYVGGGTLFTNDQTLSTMSLLVLENIVIVGADVGAGKGTIFDLSITSQSDAIFVLIYSIIFQDFYSLGTIENIILYWDYYVTRNIEFGLNIINPFQITITEPTLYGSVNQNTTYYNITGTFIFSIVFSNLVAFLSSNEKAIFVDPSISLLSLTVTISSCNLRDNFLASGSVDHTELIASFAGNSNIQNSTVKGKLTLLNNALITTITTVNTPTKINAIWQDGSIEERIVFQDLCTFDNVTDTVITTFTHNLSNGDMVTLFTYSGALPSELSDNINYYIVNSTATTFQLSLTVGGAAIDFTDNGSGTLYYRHDTGNIDSGWLIYVGLENISLSISGWVVIKSTTGTNVYIGAYTMKSDIAGTITSKSRGSGTTVNSINPQASIISDIIDLSTGEGILIYLENRTNNTNLVAVDSEVIFNKS